MPTRPLPLPVIYTGADSGNAALVRGFDAETGGVVLDRQVFEAGFTGGVRVGAADLTNDAYPDVVVGAGAGGGPRVGVLDGRTGERVPGPLGDFFAFDPTFRGGVQVAAGDVDGDRVPDMVAAAGTGGGPHIRVFSGRDGSLVSEFFAFESEFRGGVSVAVADFTGDRRAEIALGAGAGGSSRVRVVDGLTGVSIGGPLGDFFAFGSQTRGGVNVGTDAVAGDVTGDGRADLVLGTGRGESPEVRILDGVTGAEVRRFSAFAESMTGGVRVATAFVSDDPYADVVAAPAMGGAVRVFDGVTGDILAGPMGEFSPFGPNVAGGVQVAASNDPPVVVGVFTYHSEFDASQTIEVTVTVDRETPAYGGRYLWNYNVRNVTFDAAIPSGDGGPDMTSGIEEFSLYLDTESDIQNIGNSAGWMDNYFPSESIDTLFWQGGLMLPGEEADFWFTTVPVAVGPSGVFFNPPEHFRKHFAQGDAVGPGSALGVDLDLDADRSGTVEVENSSNDDLREESVGGLLIADKDGVYNKPPQGAKPEDMESQRARRRELKVKADTGVNKVIIQRTASNVRLFTTKANDEPGDTEITFNANEAEVNPNGTYWMQGGDTPSASVRSTLLKAKPKGAAQFVDTVALTVLWVELSGHTGVTDNITSGTPYEHHAASTTYLGSTKRGVHPNTGGEPTWNHGIIEIQGAIQPTNIRSYDPNAPTLTHGFVDGGNANPPVRSSAAYGFVFHRDVDAKRYNNGLNESVTEMGVPALQRGIDDSLDIYQDTNPDDLNGKTVIIDIDAPNNVIFPDAFPFGYAGHMRSNFKEWVSFTLISGKPERCSPRLDWSWTGDMALNTSQSWSYIYDRANNAAATNEVRSNHQLNSLEVGVPAPTITDANVVGAANGMGKILPAQAGFSIRITGTNLMGKVTLKGAGDVVLTASIVRVKETDAAARYSDLTEVVAYFDIQPIPGQYTLQISNAATPNPIGSIVFTRPN